MQTFSIDLNSLLRSFSATLQSGELVATQVHLTKQRDLCDVQLVFARGTLTSAIITNKKGKKVAEGNKAVELLTKQGALDWNWTPSATVNTAPLYSSPLSFSSLSSVPLSEFSPAYPNTSSHSSYLSGKVPHSDTLIADFEEAIPHLAIDMKQIDIQQLPRHQRRTLVLIDGHRNLHKIAQLLSPSERADLPKILQELQNRGMIVMA